MSEITAFVYAPLWGMPTGGPFSLKLVTWLEMAGIDYAIEVENDARRGPKGKNPWVSIDGELVGDTELIIERLSRERGIDLDAHLTVRERAISQAFTRLLDEHLHQVITETHFVHPAGWAIHGQAIREMLDAPGFLRPLICGFISRNAAKQTWWRGIGRHDFATVEQMGIEDLAALTAQLGHHDYLMGDRVSNVDASFYGMLAVILQVPLPNAVRAYALAQPNLCAYHWRMTQRYFPQWADSSTRARVERAGPEPGGEGVTGGPGLSRRG